MTKTIIGSPLLTVFEHLVGQLELSKLELGCRWIIIIEGICVWVQRFRLLVEGFLYFSAAGTLVYTESLVVRSSQLLTANDQHVVAAAGREHRNDGCGPGGPWSPSLGSRD